MFKLLTSHIIDSVIIICNIIECFVFGKKGCGRYQSSVETSYGRNLGINSFIYIYHDVIGEI